MTTIDYDKLNADTDLFGKIKAEMQKAETSLELGIVKEFWFTHPSFKALDKQLRDDLNAFHLRQYRHVTGALQG